MVYQNEVTGSQTYNSIASRECFDDGDFAAYVEINFADADGDGIPNFADNCWDVDNPDQLDTDGDCPAPPYDADPACGDACEAPANLCKADIAGPPPAGTPDCKVDTWDLLLMKQEFGRTGCTPSTCAADIAGPPPGDPDGKVDSWDLLQMKKEYGYIASQCCP